jgi:hypothetical protein
VVTRPDNAMPAREDRKPLLLEGGCQCGAVRYQVRGRPFHATVCHCSICRRTSGAPMVAWFSVRPDELQVVRGAPARFRSSAQAWRSFCGACGTALTFQQDGLDEVDVTTCSLDTPEAVPPEDHTWVRSRVAWSQHLDALAAHATTRPVRQSHA